MSNDRWIAEQEAYRTLNELMLQADKSKQLFERAGLALPEPIKRLFNMTEGNTKRSRLPAVPPPETRSRPSGFQDEWIMVDVSHAMPVTMVPVALGKAGKSLRASELVLAVQKYLPEAASGSIVNTLARLKGVSIDRADDGWKLIDASKAPVLHEGKLWGLPALFQKAEVASHRRDALVHVLRHYETGLQALQILEQLKACSWLHAPLTKDLVKEDLKALEMAHKIRRRGNTKKWEIAPEKE